MKMERLRLFILVLLTITQTTETLDENPSDYTPWLNGCFRPNSEAGQQVKSYTGQQVKSYTADLEECTQHCAHTRYLAILRDQCLCLHDTETFSQVAVQSCNLRCTSIPDSTLPCGGDGGSGAATPPWSVYTTAGPRITAVTSTLESPLVEVNVSAVVKVTALFSGVVDADKVYS